MTNAKVELLEDTKKTPRVKCAHIRCRGAKVLKLNYTKEDWEKFLEELDFTYDSGFGGQELFGTVWLEDNTWLSRGEYDGSEWWEHTTSPVIHKDCL